MKYIKEIDDCFALSKLEKEDLYKSVEFPILTNYRNYYQNMDLSKFQYYLNVNYSKELLFFENAFYYAILANGEILGTIRTVKWDHTTPIPMEEIFGISINNVLIPNNSNKTIWHIGRFAIDRKTRHNLSSQLLKMLLMYSIEPICHSQSGIVLAECDVKLLKIINKLGIKTKVLADPVLYLGSKTVPILSERDDLLFFYNKNINLMPKSLIEVWD